MKGNEGPVNRDGSVSTIPIWWWNLFIRNMCWGCEVLQDRGILGIPWPDHADQYNSIACALTMRPDHVCIKYCMSVNCFWRARCQWAVRMIDRLQSSLLICSKSPLPRQDRGVGPAVDKLQHLKLVGSTVHTVATPKNDIPPSARSETVHETECPQQISWNLHKMSL